MTRKKTIALDFDGVIHRYTGWNEGKLNEPIPAAREAIEEMIGRGYDVYVFTSRAPSLVRTWLQVCEFPRLIVTNEKLNIFSVMLDDRAILFDGHWSNQLIDRLITFEPYWKEAKDGRDTGEDRSDKKES